MTFCLFVTFDSMLCVSFLHASTPERLHKHASSSIFLFAALRSLFGKRNEVTSGRQKSSCGTILCGEEQEEQAPFPWSQ